MYSCGVSTNSLTEIPHELRGTYDDVLSPCQSPQQFQAESGVKSQETRKYICHSLRDVVRNHGNSFEEQLDCMQLVMLLALMLNFDPAIRVTPTQALETQFITMQHLAMHTNLHRYVCAWLSRRTN